MRIDVADLKKSPGESIEVELSSHLPDLEFQGEKLSFDGPARVFAKISNTGRALIVKGKVTGALKVHCGRCLEPFSLPLEVQLSEVYYPADDEDFPAVDPSAEEAQDWIPFSGNVLDITPEVLKSILLEMPMRFLCREECRGLCSFCGQNLNRASCTCEREEIDPRLSVLKEIFKN
jgi:uncharacterized protein